jgi:L-fuculokinase
MKCYLGVDIGTTNTKAVCVGNEGSIVGTLKKRTPVKIVNGVHFIDLSALDKIVDGFLTHFKSRYEVAGVSFTSIGESVVPVLNREPQADPLLWYDEVTREISLKVYPGVQQHLAYRNTGSQNDHTLGLYKMLWTRERFGLKKLDHWLPLSSYFIFKYTGVPVWDYSQAARSYLLDIHKRCWSAELLARFHLEDSLGPLYYMGRHVGRDREGTDYFLGGHDHITGLFFIQGLAGSEPFIYDSVGSSAFTVTLAEESDEELHLTKPFMEPNGIIGPAFHPGQYYLQNSIRYAGKLLERLLTIFGLPNTNASFLKINRSIASIREESFEPCLFLIGGDPHTGFGKNRFSLMNVTLDADSATIMYSAYLYLCTMTMLIASRLSQFSGSPYRFLTGGGMTENRFLLRCKSSILNQPIFVLDVTELSALGSVYVAAAGAEEKNTAEKIRQAVTATRIDPDPGRQPFLQEAAGRLLEEYGRLDGKFIDRFLR